MPAAGRDSTTLVHEVRQTVNLQEYPRWLSQEVGTLASTYPGSIPAYPFYSHP